MFKAGDDVQALDGTNWYNAKVIRRLEQELEAYEIHYKGWNKRFDCVKYSKEIRHPEVLIKDPSPSPKSKARMKAAHEAKVSVIGKVAKKGTHVKKVRTSLKKKSYLKNNSNDISIDADIKINAETPSKIESQMLNGIKATLKAYSIVDVKIDKIKEQYRAELSKFSSAFAQSQISSILQEPTDDGDIVNWEDMMS